MQIKVRYESRLARRWAESLSKQRIQHAARVLAPTLLALTLTSVAHAQGTMDFSGAQTLMGTFKTLLAFMRRADEGTLSRLMVETTILLAASRQNGTSVLKDAATLYKVNTEAIGQKVKQEFAAKVKAKKERR
jgi:ParB family chromosome partitioning protein